jgi:hypothetical protein
VALAVGLAFLKAELRTGHRPAQGAGEVLYGKEPAKKPE